MSFSNRLWQTYFGRIRFRWCSNGIVSIQSGQRKSFDVLHENRRFSISLLEWHNEVKKINILSKIYARFFLLIG